MTAASDNLPRLAWTVRKLERHRVSWADEGPGLIFILTGRMGRYAVAGYPARFKCPRLLGEAEIRRAAAVGKWPTDGKPTVRPNRGVVFVPAMAGTGYRSLEGQMPSPCDSLS